MKPVEPLFVAPLLPQLDLLLLELLRSLGPSDWERQTVATGWRVKDVAAHLLDGNLRTLSILRDGYKGENSSGDGSYESLVAYLNKLNADWTAAFRRVSPIVVTDLLEITGKPYCDYLQSLDPFAPAFFSVGWAGEAQSQNWFHIAREYTEKWHHQQQIRFAVGDNGTLLTERLYFPYLDTSMRALPYHYRTIDARAETAIRFVIRGLACPSWELVRFDEGWSLCTEYSGPLACSAEIEANAAWRIFTKGIGRVEAEAAVRIDGDGRLGTHILDMIAVMA